MHLRRSLAARKIKGVGRRRSTLDSFTMRLRSHLLNPVEAAEAAGRLKLLMVQAPALTYLIGEFRTYLRLALMNARHLTMFAMNNRQLMQCFSSHNFRRN